MFQSLDRFSRVGLSICTDAHGTVSGKNWHHYSVSRFGSCRSFSLLSTIAIELDLNILELDTDTPIPIVVIIGFPPKKNLLEMIDSVNGDLVMYRCMEQSWWSFRILGWTYHFQVNLATDKKSCSTSFFFHSRTFLAHAHENFAKVGCLFPDYRV